METSDKGAKPDAAPEGRRRNGIRTLGARLLALIGIGKRYEPANHYMRGQGPAFRRAAKKQ